MIREQSRLQYMDITKNIDENSQQIRQNGQNVNRVLIQLFKQINILLNKQNRQRRNEIEKLRLNIKDENVQQQRDINHNTKDVGNILLVQGGQGCIVLEIEPRGGEILESSYSEVECIWQ